MKIVTGYVIKRNNDIVGATSNEGEAIYLARMFKGISYRVSTFLDSSIDLAPVQVVAYDGTI